MNQGPRPEKEALTIIRAFSLCENFGWTLDDLGVPKEKQTTFVEGFLTIISERNKQKEHENKMQELRMRNGR